MKLFTIKSLFFSTLAIFSTGGSCIGQGNATVDFSASTVAATSKSTVRENHSLILAETFLGGSGGDFYYGSTGPDVAKGQSGPDSLFGAESSDTLEGGSQGDYLDGGPGGGDHCTGNSGPDAAPGAPACEQRVSI